MTPLRARTGARTHAGCVRARNEDDLCVREDAGLWAVADGMGGHAGGEWASAAIVEQLNRVSLPPNFERACEAIADGIHFANAQIHAAATERGVSMGSTVVGLYLRDRRFAVFWAGDSRAYLLRHGTLHQLSTDHSQVQEMVDRGLLTPEQALHHPMGHVLVRAVGVAATLELDIVVDEAVPGDVFLLCSDGLHGFVSDPEIASLLDARSGRDAPDLLVDLTLERGAPDNVTVVTIGLAETTLLRFGGGR